MSNANLVRKTISRTERIYRVELEGSNFVALPAGRGWRIWEGEKPLKGYMTRGEAEAALRGYAKTAVSK